MPRRGEYRIRTQVDLDHYEAFDRRDYGMPSVSWLYWHNPNHFISEKRILCDPWAPYVDPVTGDLRKMTPTNAKERHETG